MENSLYFFNKSLKITHAQKGWPGFAIFFDEIKRGWPLEKNIYFL